MLLCKKAKMAGNSIIFQLPGEFYHPVKVTIISDIQKCMESIINKPNGAE